jgi:2-hydroxychromene-2-carboxylate isomerase
MANSRGFKEAHLPSAEFWYEFASTYSYPAALRVAALAEERGVLYVARPRADMRRHGHSAQTA